ncbi:MAG: presenilin family intramembrane aspartyl protease [Nanoarchaeota archaeon]
MKHKPQIIIILLSMFILTQFIGLYVINYYSNPANELPLGMGYPQTDLTCTINSLGDFFSCTQFLGSIIFAFIIAITLFLFLTKIRAEFIIRLWFFFVVAIALMIFLQSVVPVMKYAFFVSGLLALCLAFFKIFKRNLWVHNLTELLVYPGIAAVFVPILNIYSVLILLILISLYDMWAVWHTGIMQKMAKYQINKVKVFSGFFVPYMSRKVRLELKKLKKSQLKNKKIKVNVAILGGGDVVFPIITAGVVMLTYGLFYSLFVIAGAALGLLCLFIYSEKRKFYPAMPFITLGIFLGLLVGWLVSLL